VQIEKLSNEDQAQIYRVCQNAGVRGDDPMVMFLIEWQGLRNQIVDIARGKKEGLEHLVTELREQAGSIGQTMEVQKSIAETLDEQLNFSKWFRFRFLSLWAGVAFALGVSAGVGTLLAIEKISSHTEPNFVHKRL